MRADDEGGLAELAAFYGIQTSYTDVDGVDQQARPRGGARPPALSRRARRSARGRAGASCGSKRPARSAGTSSPSWSTASGVEGCCRRPYRRASRRTRSGSRWSSRTGRPAGVPLRAVAAPSATSRQGSPSGGPAACTSTSTAWRSRPVPAGYHHLTLEAAGVQESALVVAAPDCPQGRRQWGVFLPLHALRTEHDAGVGTYEDLGRLGSWVSSLGGGLVGTLPLYPAFLEPPADPSPYLPVTQTRLQRALHRSHGAPRICGVPGRLDLLHRRGRDRRRTGSTTRRWPGSDDESSSRWQAPSAPAGSPLGVAVSTTSRRHIRNWWPTRDSGPAGRPRRAGREPDPAAVDYHLYTQWVACEQLAAVAHQGGRYADFPGRIPS